MNNVLFCSSYADSTAAEPPKSKRKKYFNERSDFIVNEIRHFLRPFFLTSIKLATNIYFSPCFESIHLQVFYNLPLNVNIKRSIPLSVSVWNYSLFICSFLVLLLGLFMSSLECRGRNLWTNYRSQYRSTVPCLFYWLSWNAIQFLMLSRVFPL